jgi:hypothetical protein
MSGIDMNSLSTVIKSHWKGEIPFPKSYLFVIFLIALVVRKLTVLSFSLVTWNDSLVNKVFLSYVLSLGLLITAWCGVGAIRYLINKVSSTAALLGFIIFAVILIYTVRTYYFVILYATT